MRAKIFKDRQKGQSLVETAFALPILLMLAVGIVELGYALNAYIQTVNAAREGARFGSMGGNNEAVTSIVQGAPSYLKSYDESNSDLYVVRAELTGTAPNCTMESFTCEPTLNSSVLDTSCPTQDEILARLASQELTDCDLDVIAVDLYYRSSSLLGLPLVKQLSEAVPMRSLTVMRVESPRPMSGICNAYPIAVHQSVLAGKQKGELIEDIYNGSGSGNFGWLRWPNDPSGGSADELKDALTRPTTDEFTNAQDPHDHALSVGDWIWGNTGLSPSSGNRWALDNLINRGWIRIVVWDEYADAGAKGMYRAVDFAIIELVNYDLPHNQNRISVRFIGFDSTGCEE
jgi:Flp pilus assembly protein TadG